MSGERMPFPTQREVIQALIEQALLDVHVALPGRVQSYDATTQTADVVVQVQHRYPDPGGSGDYLAERVPVIPSVPVLFPRFGRWFLAASVAAGDPVQLLVNSASIADWRAGDGRPQMPSDIRRHHISHAVALGGLDTRENALRHAPPSAEPTSAEACLTIGTDDAAGTRISIYGDKRVALTQGSSVVLEVDAAGVVHLGGPAGQLVALAALVKSNLDALKAIFDSWSPVPSDGGMALKTLLNGWTVQDVAAVKTKAT